MKRNAGMLRAAVSLLALFMPALLPVRAALAAEEVGIVFRPAAGMSPDLGSASVGHEHGCAVRTDGTVACWGNNSLGQASPPAGSFVQVVVGELHSCALGAGGGVVCWGDNSQGQGTPPPGTFTQLAAGEAYTCGLGTDGAVACWGINSYGQVMPPAGTFTQVAAGETHACGLKTDGTLACWGRGLTGQNPPPAATFTQVSVGDLHACGVKTDGNVLCWGDNTAGQSAAPSGTFTRVSSGGMHTCGLRPDGLVQCWGADDQDQSSPPSEGFTGVAAGYLNTCGLRVDGTLVCWGNDHGGQGTPPQGTFSRPRLSAGSNHTCALHPDGSLACWGDNGYGQSSPPAGTFTQAAAGGNHSCAVRTNGTIACWGSDSDSVSTPPPGTFVQVASGEYHSCAVRADGSLVCWGYNAYNQCSPPAGRFTQAAVGRYHSCARKTDGTVVCWGYNGFGQCDAPPETMTQVAAGGAHSCGVSTGGSITCWGLDGYGQSSPPAATFTQVAAGETHACGVKTNGTLACWGRNDRGQSSPPAGGFTQVVSGTAHSCGIRDDGSFVCWGDPASGAVATVRFDTADFSGSESTTAARARVVLSAASTRTITVKYATRGGTAVSGSDFAATAGTLTFSPGQTVKTISVPVVNDSAVEDDESFRISLTNPVHAVLGAPSTYTYTIVDEDLHGAILLGSAALTVGESGSAAKVTVRRVGGSNGGMSVGYETADGTATAGKDYTPASGTLTWVNGDKADQTITVPVLDDDVDERSETFTIVLRPISNARLGWPGVATVTIVDDEPTPTVRFSATSSANEESNGARVGVSLSGASDRWVTVRYSTSDGSAVAGRDYVARSATLGIPPGGRDASCFLSIVNERAVEVDESFRVRLSSPVNAVLGSPSNHVVTIVNDDFHGTIQLLAASFQVSEAGSAATITARRLGGSSGEASVRLATAGGTAASGTDFTATSKVLTWADGDAADKTVTVPIFGDSLDEPDETFSVGLSAPTGGATLAAPRRAIVTIADDDPIPTVQFRHAGSSGAELLTPAAMEAHLSAPSGRTVSVRYETANIEAEAGRDYLAATGTLTFLPGQVSRTIAVPIVNDAAREPDERFAVTLSNPVNAALGAANVTYLYTIRDEDTYGAIRLGAASLTVREGVKEVAIPVQRIGGAGGRVDVDYETLNGTATAGSDYATAFGRLSWESGDRAGKSITVRINGDTADEADETFTVWLLSPTGGAVPGSPYKATVTIVDDDPPPTVRLSEAVSTGLESVSPVSFRVNLSAVSARTVTVAYATAGGTAAAGGDFVPASGVLTFLPGETTQEVSVALVDDAVDEPDEAFALKLGSPVNAVLGAPSRRTHRIANDDPKRTLGFAAWSSEGAESAGAVVLNVWLVPLSPRTVTVRYATVNGSAVAGRDFTGTSGTLTFLPGQMEKRIRVPILDNATPEPDETFTVALSNPVNATISSTSGVHTHTILDEDTHGAIVLDSTACAGGEAAGSLTITARRTGGAEGPIGVTYRFGENSATQGVDFPGVSGLLSWGAGERGAKPIVVEVTDDSRDEIDEDFLVALFDPQGGAVVGAPSRALVTILDDDPPPTAQFKVAWSAALESEAAFIEVTLSQPSEKKVSVEFATADGTAAAGQDYASQRGTLEFGWGTTSRTIAVPLVFDGEPEADETFSVTLSKPVNATLGSPSRHDFTIFNEDIEEPPPWEPDEPVAAGAMRRGGHAASDFDGDGRSDVGVYDPAAGSWDLRLSSGGGATMQFGAAGMVPVVADFDGDGRSDFGLFGAAGAAGEWTVRLSGGGERTERLGIAGGVPVAADFDGDGRDDFGVYDPASATWWLGLSTAGEATVQFGSAESVPVVGDFDGDGRADLGICEPATGTWSLRLGDEGARVVRSGSAGIVPVTGDFDGDGTTDCGGYMPGSGNWEISLSSGGRRMQTLACPDGTLIVGDYDGDGASDIGCYSPAKPARIEGGSQTSGSWMILRSRDGLGTDCFGGAGAIPLGGR